MSKVYDVCLLLEGTFPFVSGGVSTWVYNLVRGLPELEFTAVCILPSDKDKRQIRYDLPDNFRDYRVMALHDVERLSRGFFSPDKTPAALMANLHAGMRKNSYSGLKEISRIFGAKRTKPALYHLIHGRKAWHLLRSFYEQEAPSESFLDYFWTYRFTHLPIFKLLGADIPRARVYHTISTGYAGLLGAIANIRYGRPLLLTEHGIYVKERKIEIAQAEWIYVAGKNKFRVQRELGTFQKLWIRVFETLGHITYHFADRIYTLYEGNRQLQIAEGAPPEKIEVIPNGIDEESFRLMKPPGYPHPDQHEFVIGFVGRVVPIKDVKTFIRACKIVSLRLPDIKVLIMGPYEEDEQYYEECRELVDLLHLGEVVEFTGKVNVKDYYPQIDLLVLTSISEGQPLVILEANCAGIPCVASDVGSCRELLEGRTAEDKEIGPSGFVTGVADPADTAQAMLRILTDYYLRQRMSIAGRIRVGMFYREAELNREYLSIYREYMEKPDERKV